MNASAAFTAISEIPLLGTLHAAIDCANEACTNGLEQVPSACFNLSHHS
jgi:hypothetical protein